MGNLKNRTSNPNVNSTSVLSEDFHYDLNNRLTSSQVTNGSGTQAAVTYAYDLAGDITCKSDVVSHDCSTTPSGYDYTVTPGIPGGPHAVKTAGSSTYAYDADGNMTSRAGTAITWNSDGLPLSISQDASNNSAFSYAPDKHRYKQVAMAAGVPTTTIYAGGMQIISTGTTTTYEMTLTAYGRSVVMEDLTNSGTNAQGKKSVLLTDNLGSVDTVVDATAMTSQGQSFDSFGRRRNAGSWQSGSGSGTGTSSQHGFTDHEQLDNVGLVHMNGRVMDPTVGRFLSVDPMVGSATNSQAINPYSYVMNNPLSLVDPSGYCAATMADENDANTTVCGQGDNDAGSHEYNGHNGSQTGSHIGDGHTTGINGGDLGELKTQQFGRFTMQLNDAVHKQYGANATVAGFGINKSGDAEMVLTGNGAKDSQLANVPSDQNADAAGKGSPASQATGSLPGANRLVNGTTINAEDRAALQGMTSMAVYHAWETLKDWKASGTMTGDWANDPNAIFSPQIRYQVESGFASGQGLSTCAGRLGCTAADYSYGTHVSSIYGAAVVATGIMNVRALTGVVLHEFEHSTDYGHRLYDSFWARNPLTGASIVATNPEMDISYERDAIQFSQAAMQYYHP